MQNVSVRPGGWIFLLLLCIPLSVFADGEPTGFEKCKQGQYRDSITDDCIDCEIGTAQDDLDQVYTKHPHCVCFHILWPDLGNVVFQDMCDECDAGEYGLETGAMLQLNAKLIGAAGMIDCHSCIDGSIQFMKIATECKGGAEINLNKGYWTPSNSYVDGVAGPYFKCYSPSGRCNGTHIV